MSGKQSALVLFSTHLTDGERSLRVNCEFCQVDTKLYNMGKLGKEDKNK